MKPSLNVDQDLDFCRCTFLRLESRVIRLWIVKTKTLHLISSILYSVSPWKWKTILEPKWSQTLQKDEFLMYLNNFLWLNGAPCWPLKQTQCFRKFLSVFLTVLFKYSVRSIKNTIGGKKSRKSYLTMHTDFNFKKKNKTPKYNVERKRVW